MIPSYSGYFKKPNICHIKQEGCRKTQREIISIFTEWVSERPGQKIWRNFGSLIVIRYRLYSIALHTWPQNSSWSIRMMVESLSLLYQYLYNWKDQLTTWLKIIGNPPGHGSGISSLAWVFFNLTMHPMAEQLLFSPFLPNTSNFWVSPDNPRSH
jgi:hypothetical protein